MVLAVNFRGIQRAVLQQVFVEISMQYADMDYNQNNKKIIQCGPRIVRLFMSSLENFKRDATLNKLSSLAPFRASRVVCLTILFNDAHRKCRT